VFFVFFIFVSFFYLFSSIELEAMIMKKEPWKLSRRQQIVGKYTNAIKYNLEDYDDGFALQLFILERA
jgi:hypothetical protein